MMETILPILIDIPFNLIKTGLWLVVAGILGLAVFEALGMEPSDIKQLLDKQTKATVTGEHAASGDLCDECLKKVALPTPVVEVTKEIQAEYEYATFGEAVRHVYREAGHDV